MQMGFWLHVCAFNKYYCLYTRCHQCYLYAQILFINILFWNNNAILWIEFIILVLLHSSVLANLIFHQLAFLLFNLRIHVWVSVTPCSLLKWLILLFNNIMYMKILLKKNNKRINNSNKKCGREIFNSISCTEEQCAYGFHDKCRAL